MFAFYNFHSCSVNNDSIQQMELFSNNLITFSNVNTSFIFSEGCRVFKSATMKNLKF